MMEDLNLPTQLLHTRLTPPVVTLGQLLTTLPLNYHNTAVITNSLKKELNNKTLAALTDLPTLSQSGLMNNLSTTTNLITLIRPPLTLIWKTTVIGLRPLLFRAEWTQTYHTPYQYP